MDLEHVNQNLLAKYNQLLDAVRARGGKPITTSGYRSIAEQQKLYASGNGGVPVAKPGQSKHNENPAEAIDVTGDAKTMDLLHSLAPNFGLAFPVANDPVHVEFASPTSSSATAQTVALGNPVSALSGAGDFLKMLTQLSTWIRVFEVVLGAVLIGIGIALAARNGLG